MFIILCVLGLHCYSSCGSKGYSVLAEPRPLSVLVLLLRSMCSRVQAQELWNTRIDSPQHVGSSWTKD